jgi:hypothetical protein
MNRAEIEINNCNNCKFVSGVGDNKIDAFPTLAYTRLQLVLGDIKLLLLFIFVTHGQKHYDVHETRNKTAHTLYCFPSSIIIQPFANMMMSKPKQEEEEAPPPSFATRPAPPKVGTVEDLQNRLAMLGGEDDKKPAPVMQASVVVPPSVAATTAPAVVKGGKNALLVSTKYNNTNYGSIALFYFTIRPAK